MPLNDVHSYVMIHHKKNKIRNRFEQYHFPQTVSIQFLMFCIMKDRSTIPEGRTVMKKYVSILLDMEEKIMNHQYSPGQKLPSVRKAAKIYDCSISTITSAYSELEKRHVIYSVPQSGFYVVAKPDDESDHKGNEMIDFTSASPDLNVFPYLDFQHCLNKAIDMYKYHLFTYGG